MTKSDLELAAEFFDRTSIPPQIAELWGEWREMDAATAKLVRAAVSSRSPKLLRQTWDMLHARAALAQALRRD